MKKMISMILAFIMAASLACTALARETAQPEGGKKFETDWAIQDAVIKIDYEEEGYRVQIVSEDPDEGKGTEWDYSCYYHEDEDALVSMASSRQDFTFRPGYPDEKDYEAAVYDGLDEEGTATVFTIDGNGRLIWKDGHENMGQDLEFINIGRFFGAWKNSAEEVYADFSWDGHDDRFYYNVFLQRGNNGADTYTVFHMTGVYNAASGKLECTGSAVTYTKNAAGGYDESNDGQTYQASFSRTPNGGILFEAGSGIVLEEDFDVEG